MRNVFFIFLCLCLGVNVSSIAQSTMATDTIMLKSVSVNANRINTSGVAKSALPLRDLPISASAIGMSTLKQKGQDNLLQSLRSVSGVRTKNNYGGFQTFKIRGFGDFAFLVDGVRDERHNLSSSAPFTSLVGVERVEVLKGPASVLFGHSALGGVINIVRKKPTDQFSANASSSIASWNKYKFELGLGDSLNRKVNYRFDASQAYGDNWRDAKSKSINFYAALDYKISRNNILEFRAGGNKDFYATETGIPVMLADIFNLDGEKVLNKGDFPINYDREQRYNNPDDFLNHKNFNVSVKYLHTFNNGNKLTNYLSYSYDDIDYFSTEELAFLTSAEKKYKNYYMSASKKKYICIDSFNRAFPLRFSHKTKTLQNQLELKGQKNLYGIVNNWLVAYSFSYLDRTSYSVYGKKDVWGNGKNKSIAVISPELNRGYLNSKFSAASVSKEYVNGIFGQNHFTFSDKFKALVALRYDMFTRNTFGSKVKNELDIYDQNETKKLNSSALTYRLGLVYQPADKFTLYSSYSNYFKPSRTLYNSDYIYINNTGNRINPDDDNLWEPTTGYQCELGARLSLTNKLNINASVYIINKKNVASYLGKHLDGKSPAPKRVYGQIGSAYSKGFELDMVFMPLDCIRLTSSYTFNIAKYKDFKENKYTSNSLEGNSYDQTPKHQVFAWMYANIINTKNNKLSLGVGGEWVDDCFTNSSNTYTFKSHYKFDSSINYSLGKYFVQLNANNIFDAEYEENAIMDTQFFPAPPRNFMLTIGFNIN